MGRRRNIDKAETAEQTEVTRRLSARVKQRIVKLYDLPATVSQIAQDVGLPASTVRRTLAETCPADAKQWRNL